MFATTTTMARRRRRHELILATLILSFACLSQGKRPNILVLLTDDQDVLLGGTDYMPNLKGLLMNKGTTFTNFFVHTPVCCPSRASILTGRYLHNINVLNNTRDGNCYGMPWKNGPEKATFAVFARQAGYNTGYAGKFLNGYSCEKGRKDCTDVPPGWNHWMGLWGNSAFYSYTVTVSDKAGEKKGTAEYHGKSYKKDYFPDLLVNRTIKSMREFSKSQSPFLLMLAWPAPHGPAIAAPMDLGLFPGIQAPRTLNWNSTDEQNAAKHWFVRVQPSITEESALDIDMNYRRRQQSLQAVDRHIKRLVDVLRQEGELNNTIIIYTSDNGFQLGQHRRVYDKRLPYEHDIRVPMIVRGPGVPKNAIIDRAVLSIDLAPTIVHLAAGSDAIPKVMDGQSFVPLLQNQSAGWRSDFLVSYHGEGDPPCGLSSCNNGRKKVERVKINDATNNTYHCVRSLAAGGSVQQYFENTMYCQFKDDEDFVEYYNLTEDPWQLNNGASGLTVEEQENASGEAEISETLQRTFLSQFLELACH